MHVHAARAALAALAAWALPALAQPHDATAATRAANQAARAQLPLADQRAFDDARHGLVEAADTLVVPRADGRPAWTLRGYEFLGTEQAPDTVHPALWRHARVNMANGLFKVTDRLYQVRGFDLANMTILEGDTGLVVVDPLTTVETARAGMELYFRHRPRKPVVAVVYTHSHVDHFGGARGVVDDAALAAGRVAVIAPAGFLHEAVAENLIAGPAMSRRAPYQFGSRLPRGPRGTVDAGLGKTTALGTISLVPPTRLIEQPVETHRIDGIEIVFALAPGAEAPAEMVMHYPQLRVLNMAEIVTQAMHNLLPMRGAQVRDALAWSRHIDDALHRWGADSDILIAQHHWPVRGRERVQELLANQRDLYRYLHDQTVRRMNQGYVGSEIAQVLQLPPALLQDWSTRPFYGHLGHNIQAIYQRYLGYYDGNPVHLEALPPAQAARRTIAYMGGADAVLARAREDYARGDYRWVAQVASQLVYAEPARQDARALAADAYEQLGYQQESATARNAFLQGAAELRNGPPPAAGPGTASPDLVRSLPLDLYFDHLAVRIDGERAQGRRIVLNWLFTDTGQQHMVTLRHGALSHRADAQSPAADATLRLARATLDDISLQRTTFPEAIAAGRIVVSGRVEAVQELLGLVDRTAAAAGFPIVEPRRGPGLGP